MTPFALALETANLRPSEYCRAVAALTGQPYSPTMTSRWISGMHEAPLPAIALAALIGSMKEGDRKRLTKAPARKKYTRKSLPDS